MTQISGIDDVGVDGWGSRTTTNPQVSRKSSLEEESFERGPLFLPLAPTYALLSEGLVDMKSSASYKLAFVVLLILNRSGGCECWSSSHNNNQHHKNGLLLVSANSRRRFLVNTMGSAATFFLCTSQPAKSACLPGDERPDCIGVYKVPIDPAILPYVETPEALGKFAPDINYVPPIQPPKSFQQAVEVLQTQRLAADDIVSVISAGRLEEAGIKVLNLLPKVTSAGKLVVDTLQGEINSKPPSGSSSDTIITELRLSKLEQEFQLVVALWNEADLVIGQGLRGELGVSAVAQLQILSSLRDAIAATDDFLVTVDRRAN